MTLLRIERTWDGAPCAPGEEVTVLLRRELGSLVVEVDAPWHGDPLPLTPPGPVDGLWEFEVVELFVLGADERYLEIELGPGGHHLVLELLGRRSVVRSGMALDYAVERAGARWTGCARIPADWLPPGASRGNAYAIHGRGEARRHLAWTAVPGGAPDFHRLEHFGPLTLPG